MIYINIPAFKETLINTLKYDDEFKLVGHELLPIVSRSDINDIPQYEYTHRSGQHWENIELRVPIPLINKAKENKGKIKELFNYVYEETDEFDLDEVLIKPKIIKAAEEYTEHDVVFDEIHDTLVQGIRDAKYLIWVAVAWFTDESFYQELIERKKQGVNVRIIVSDEESNNVLLPKLKAEFDTTVIPHFGFKNYNRMHDKFCIIDLDYVMHGSYNWTKAAEYNGETLATALDHEFVKKFADEFMNIYTTQRCS